jgi:hypothetical protein
MTKCCAAVRCCAVQVGQLEEQLQGEQARLGAVTGELTVSQQQVEGLREAATAAQAELAAEVGVCEGGGGAEAVRGSWSMDLGPDAS